MMLLFTSSRAQWLLAERGIGVSVCVCVWEGSHWINLCTSASSSDVCGIEESCHYITLHSAFNWLYDVDTTLRFFTAKCINYTDGKVKTRIILNAARY